MLSVAPFEIAALKTGKNRLLGVDHGEKRVGLALSDLTWVIATPFKTLPPSELLTLFPALVAAENIAAVIIGWPLNMDGGEGERCRAVERFAAKSRAVVSVPFYPLDERLSTLAVRRTVIEADLSRNRQKRVIDKMAAAYLLQGFLDGLGS